MITVCIPTYCSDCRRLGFLVEGSQYPRWKHPQNKTCWRLCKPCHKLGSLLLHFRTVPPLVCRKLCMVWAVLIYCRRPYSSSKHVTISCYCITCTYSFQGSDLDHHQGLKHHHHIQVCMHCICIILLRVFIMEHKRACIIKACITSTVCMCIIKSLS